MPTGEGGQEDVAELQQQIAELSSRLRQPGTVETLRSYWNRVTTWMSSEPGEARPAEG